MQDLTAMGDLTPVGDRSGLHFGTVSIKKPARDGQNEPLLT